MASSQVPAWPDVVPASSKGAGMFVTRYEDVSQDGRIALRALSNGIGAAVWRATLLRHPAYAVLRDTGILPILARLVLEGGGGPISVGSDVSAEGTFVLTRAVDARGEARMRIDMWADMTGIAGCSHGPGPANAGQSIPLGRMYAEQVLTRPFAPPDQRKVSVLPEGHGLEERRADWSVPEGLLALPEGASWIEGEAGGEQPDPSTTVFGVGHTDSNQHVNSLVYPLLLEEAALRWAHQAWGAAPRFARFVELRYRKPFFAGETCRVILRGYRAEADVIGVLARFVAPGSEDRPHAYARLELAT